MILEMKPLSMTEAKELAEAAEETNKETPNFLKKFIKLDEKQAQELKKEIEKLENLKIKEEHIVKIIDLMPEDAMDLNKIFIDAGLDDDENNKLLEIIKKYK